MKRFAIVGHSDFFGDVVDTIHAIGGRVDCVVLNRPDLRTVGHLTVDQRLERIPYEVPLRLLSDVHFDGSRSVVIGFLGPGKRTLVENVDTPFETLIHPDALVSPTVRIGCGSFLGPGCVIGPHTILDDHTVVKRGATVGHDCRLGAFAQVLPGSDLAGYVRLCQDSIVSIGASVIEDVTVGEGSLVAAGSAVIEDVPPYSLVAGVPATVKKRLAEPGQRAHCAASR